MKYVVGVALAFGCGTQTLKVEPVKVETIHMTIDVNLHDGRPAEPPRR